MHASLEDERRRWEGEKSAAVKEASLRTREETGKELGRLNEEMARERELVEKHQGQISQLKKVLGWGGVCGGWRR